MGLSTVAVMQATLLLFFFILLKIMTIFRQVEAFSYCRLQFDKKISKPKICTRFAIRRFRWSNGISSSLSFLESSSFRTAIPVSTSSRYFWKISLSVSLYKLIALSYSSMTLSWSPTKKSFYVTFGITVEMGDKELFGHLKIVP